MESKRNLWLLPTDKPSRLGYLTKKGKEVYKDLRLFDRIMPNILDSENQHIYITSDEEIKEGDWFLGLADGSISPFVRQANKSTVEINNWQLNKKGTSSNKKIIITTDQDLIKDGVQAIDDEFLEWFVKNPSCEEVEMEKYHGINTSIAEINYISGDDSLGWQGKNDLRDYKIIIPKEETKQHVEFFNLKNISSKNIPSEFNDIINKEFFNLIEEPKQETIEEAACVKHRELLTSEIGIIPNFEDGFVEGIKWQAEQDKNEPTSEEILEALKKIRKAPLIFAPSQTMYSEEDMMFAYEQGARLALIGQSPLALHKGEFPTPKEWFKQFKKK